MHFIGVSALFAATLLLATGIAGADDRLPVDYNFFSGVPAELADPGGSLPGSNDWNCRPSVAHANPVVLLHGTGGGGQTNWGVYVPQLANEGYCVYTLTYGAYENLPWPISAVGGMRPIQQSAVEVSAFVDRVLAATGASKVDIVGHSQGTIVPNYYAKFLGGADKIDKHVSLAPAYRGSNVAAAGDIMAYLRALSAEDVPEAVIGSLCQACTQMVSGSRFLTMLNSEGVLVPGITYTNIMTRYDEVVVPYVSGYVEAPNATNIVVQDGCAQDYSEHAGIAGSPRAAAFVLNALDPEHPRPVPCEFVPPFTG
ncbi:esterase/lipase family protein [Nocardia donostiensis]|uniref:Lipase n=1 Tax=Nocardia donostiensis TaxID=1538463 RepID=A0A1V2TA64_9NOCA|nr:alpha/beta fold hydrolase [Nocardia donostiensis]ONM46402.1 lipase [Nocardia donostiensis]OQS16307.1 lipase [Nocardia donostiensis]OQS18290.1 lipase [Nocardia donostiensis]